MAERAKFEAILTEAKNEAAMAKMTSSNPATSQSQLDEAPSLWSRLSRSSSGPSASASASASASDNNYMWRSTSTPRDETDQKAERPSLWPSVGLGGGEASGSLDRGTLDGDKPPLGAVAGSSMDAGAGAGAGAGVRAPPPPPPPKWKPFISSRRQDDEPATGPEALLRADGDTEDDSASFRIMTDEETDAVVSSVLGGGADEAWVTGGLSGFNGGSEEGGGVY